MEKKTVGVIINPLAGLGGPVGLKGSDGAQVVEKALALGAKPQAAARARLALSHLLPLQRGLCLLAYEGEMGAGLLEQMGFAPTVIGAPVRGCTTSSRDTEDAACKMVEAGADLILFAGGDGTARNLCQAVGDRLPVVGIPAGVKIHSAVYAINPRNAGLVAADYLSGKIGGLRLAEVMDIDEEQFRMGRVSARLYGYMNTPDDGARIQGKKAGGVTEASDLAGMAAFVAESLERDTVYIVGPGSTTRAVMEELGLSGTLLGVDAVKNGRVIAADATEGQLWELMSDPAVRVKIILTVIGGQGSLLGRGNQQLSPRILRRVGKENLLVVSTTGKLLSLGGRSLLVDTGDPVLDQELAGHIRVHTGYGRSTICKVNW